MNNINCVKEDTRYLGFRADKESIQQFNEVMNYLSDGKDIKINKTEAFRFLLRFWTENRDLVKKT